MRNKGGNKGPNDKINLLREDFDKNNFKKHQAKVLEKIILVIFYYNEPEFKPLIKGEG